MHRFVIPKGLTESVKARRGGLHIFETIEAARTALLIVDMQNFFVAPEAPGEVPMAKRIVPAINRLAGALRAAGGTVVWISTAFTPEMMESWSVFFDRLCSAERRAMLLDSLSDGAPDQALWHPLDAKDGDWHVSKDRFSAFIQGASDIEPRLRQAGIDTVLVAGTLTNVCCESTARDAMMRNFNVVMVSDANAARSDADHSASLAAFWQVFGDVMTTDEVIDRLVPAPASAGSSIA